MDVAQLINMLILSMRHWISLNLIEPDLTKCIKVIRQDKTITIMSMTKRNEKVFFRLKIKAGFKLVDISKKLV